MMLERIARGEIPNVPHTVFRGPNGAMRYEHCLTTHAFDGAYSILYHLSPPHAQRTTSEPAIDARTRYVDDPALRKRHFRTALASIGGPPETARTPLVGNDDVEIAIVTPTSSGAAYVLEGDGDVLYFVAEGGGTLRSVFGDLAFEADDYVFVPRGVVHRFELGPGTHRWLRLTFPNGLSLCAKHRNAIGQLRMDAPFSHRDFRRPSFVGPVDEGIRALRAFRHGRAHTFALDASPLDVVGWDGALHPFALSIHAFRPRVGKVHLPPDVHATFESRGVLVSSFVPRPLDFHPDAVPCPYPHSSVDCDEVIFYVSGDFLSRRGIERGSVTLHPAGLPHGPMPGAYEASLGAKSADELAVMLDVFAPLRLATSTPAMEDAAYHDAYSLPRSG